MLAGVLEGDQREQQGDGGGGDGGHRWDEDGGEGGVMVFRSGVVFP
jgi:hypothetical protein